MNLRNVSLTSSSTWWNLVFVSTGLPVGYLTTTAVLAGAAVSLSLAIILPLAAVVLWLLFLSGHGLANLERGRILSLTNVDLADTSEPLDGDTIWRRFLNRLRMKNRWQELLYLTLRLPISFVFTTILMLLWGVGFAGVASPLYASRVDHRTLSISGIELGSPWLVVIVFLGGLLIVLFLAPLLTNTLAQADLAVARRLLSPGSRTEFEQTVDRLEHRRIAAVDSAEAERRRIERDLHDGAQQRLIAAAMNLGVARERLDTDIDSARALVDQSHSEIKAAMAELRDLVRGIHPVILEDRGLDAALSAVVARLPLPVTLAVDLDQRPHPTVESTAYFIVSEALTNVAKHAHATSAAVTIQRHNNTLTITVTDNGRGGADPAAGTGIVGLIDRAESLGGSIHLSSPHGGPTSLHVELPCEL